MAPFINIHTHHKTNAKEVQVIVLSPQEWKSNNYSEGELYSVGIHPWHSNAGNLAEQITWLEEALQKKNVLMLGEAGLDRSTAIPLEEQKSVLIPQLELAKRYSKPLIFHAVRSIPDILSVYRQSNIQQPFIIHGFIGKPEAVQQLHKANGYVSFGAKIIDNRSWDKALIEAYELNNLFFETDEAKIPVEHVYHKAAEVIEINVATLKEQVFSYFCSVFGKIV